MRTKKARDIQKRLEWEGWVWQRRRGSGSHENSGLETMTYQAIYERAEDGTIWGYTPDVPGAFGAGDTLDEAKESLREGIRLWLELARERGEAIPSSSAIASSAIAIELLDVPAA